MTGSSSRMIEVCTCLSSELFQAATLSEHAPDEVSAGAERAVITDAWSGVGSDGQLWEVLGTHMQGPSACESYSPADRQPSFRLFIFFTLCVSSCTFAGVVFSSWGTSRSKAAPLTGLLKYLCWQNKGKNFISNRMSLCIHHILWLTWVIHFLNPVHLSSEAVQKVITCGNINMHLWFKTKSGIIPLIHLTTQYSFKRSDRSQFILNVLCMYEIYKSPQSPSWIILHPPS